MKFITSFVLFVVLTGSFFISANLFIPVSSGSLENIDFTVQRGEGAKDIVSNLKKEGLIRSSVVSRAFILSSGLSHKLQAGQYLFSPSMSTWSIFRKISSGDIATKKITIIEGWKLEEIGQYLEDQGICTKQEFLELSKKDFSEEFTFLNDKPKNLSLEGYIFPDTYEFLPGASVENIIRMFLNNFDQKFTSQLRDEVKRQDKSIFETVTMASIIEREVKKIEDKKVVSGIFWKRLEIDMYLQSCATVVYITGNNGYGVSLDDLTIDSPYNTYKYMGLPVGPISNPGISSIEAAIYPTKTNYLYFLSTPSGKTIFSKTFEEHSAAQESYLR
ncbi:MAG: endolytic transglycosylase MltG [Candidatus Staskawiczbacteria bacterium]|jgi:UPF0755 protein